MKMLLIRKDKDHHNSIFYPSITNPDMYKLYNTVQCSDIIDNAYYSKNLVSEQKLSENGA